MEKYHPIIDKKINGRRLRTKFIQKDKEGNIICYNCGEYKPVGDFDINQDNVLREGRDRRCKECKRKHYQKRRLDNRGKSDLNEILSVRWYGARDRARKKNYQLDFSWEYLKELWIAQNGKCALSGIEMTFEANNGRVPTNLSLDKINPKGRYQKGNVQLICMAINQMKSDLTSEQLMRFCKSVVLYQESKCN